MIDPSILSAIASQCGFVPAVVQAFGVTSLTEAFAPGRVTVIRPVRRGEATAVYRDPVLQGTLDAGGVVVLAFEEREDADRFGRLVAEVVGTEQSHAPAEQPHDAGTADG